MRAPRSSSFSPRRVEAEDLERQLVGRHLELAALVDRIEKSLTVGAGRYELIRGPRGCGKSHLIALTVHRIRQKCREQGAFAVLDEEEHVSSLLGLLAQILSCIDGPPGVRATQQRQLQRVRGRPAEGEQRALAMLDEATDGRSLLIVLENLDELLRALGLDGRKRLRAILEERRNWSVLASSCTYPTTLSKHTEPFYGSFPSNLRLGPLDAEQCREVLRKLAILHDAQDLVEHLKTPAGRVQARAIHRLTGGMPRALILVFPFMRDGALKDLMLALYDLAETLTPYYQQQMSRLSIGQRAVVEQLAESWTPLSAREVAERAFQDDRTTSTHLRKLFKEGLVTKTRVSREVFYSLADRLHRLARSMKRREGGLAFARFIVDFLGVEEAKVRAIDLGAPGWIEVATPSPGRHADASVNRIRQLSAKGEHDQAIAAARLLLQDNDCDDAYGALLLALIEAGRAEELAECARDALRNRPGALAQAPGLVAQLLDTELTELTLEVVSAMPMASLTAADRLQHVIALRTAGESFDEVLEMHLTCIEDSAERALVLAIGADALGQHERALAAATSVPMTWELAMAATKQALMLGRNEDRLVYARAWSEMQPEQAQAWSQVGHAALALRRADVAHDAYGRAFDLDSQYADAWFANLIAGGRWHELGEGTRRIDSQTAGSITELLEVLLGPPVAKTEVAPLAALPVTSWVICHRLVQAVLLDVDERHRLDVLSPDWSVIAGTTIVSATASLCAAGKSPVEGAIAVLGRAFDIGRTAVMAEAIAALPNDALPYARLSSEEQEAVRDQLAAYEASAALESLPKPQTAADA